jgi:hypothetical protein
MQMLTPKKTARQSVGLEAVRAVQHWTYFYYGSPETFDCRDDWDSGLQIFQHRLLLDHEPEHHKT